MGRQFKPVRARRYTLKAARQFIAPMVLIMCSKVKCQSRLNVLNRLNSVTGGNFSLLGRLLTRAARILEINGLTRGEHDGDRRCKGKPSDRPTLILWIVPQDNVVSQKF
jgi:hypothetical protein